MCHLIIQKLKNDELVNNNILKRSISFEIATPIDSNWLNNFANLKIKIVFH